VNKNDLKLRTKSFAHRCVKLSLTLPSSKLGNHIMGQLIRCGTSVAANYRATCLAHSKAAFASKISIVIEEVDESEFWLQFIIDEKLIPKKLIEPLRVEASELTSIFYFSRKTVQLK
jgi:four helix bundle protein